MTSREFCYWLQGYFEISAAHPNAPERLIVNADQIVTIKRHLDMVFAHEIDPSYPRQEKLNDIHQGDKGEPWKARC